MKTTKTNIEHARTNSRYNPKLNYLDGKDMSSKKLIKAKELLSKAGLPKQVLEQFNKAKSL